MIEQRGGRGDPLRQVLRVEEDPSTRGEGERRGGGKRTGGGIKSAMPA